MIKNHDENMLRIEASSRPIMIIVKIIIMMIIIVMIIIIRMEDGPRWMHAFQFYSSLTRVEIAYKVRANLSDDDDPDNHNNHDNVDENHHDADDD